jgi:hypothetical protein
MGMASELFLGPDGGPYVSINENSGDLELKDNSGNVVAFWDESNTQWDLNSNDIQNVGSLSTGDIQGTGRPYSGADDFSDVSFYQQIKSPSNKTTYTLLDVSDGPKVVDGGKIVGGDNIRDGDDDKEGVIDVNIDGVTTSRYPGNTSQRFNDSAGNTLTNIYIPSVRYDTSLKIEWTHTGDSNQVSAFLAVHGSGPHWIAVVKDGSEPYSIARNVSDKQIEQMAFPDGYQIAKNPTTSDDVSDIWEAVWDADKQMFVVP